MLKISEKVLNFTCEAYHNKRIKTFRFSQVRRKWVVLLFYPADFTFVCPTELESAALLYPKFKKEKAEIFSVSTDTAFVHKAWHDNSPSIRKIKYPMLADPNGKICRMFGTYIEEEGLSQRASFIIDPDGILKSIEIHDNSIGRNVEEILRKLQAASFVRKNKGALVCPVNWKPGDKTLKPSEKLVGKI